ncbi:helix-turn-helix domain-containing protein [Streptomyces sulphureus]|uniref:helix-turn-helix domain-containing protein n=1 Tax=Streptomyces sulphureus TaxID=47758 RepID=UPI0003827B5F|nr:helix-turn-helix transcriptional regulator [Streptomyces sulphureus]
MHFSEPRGAAHTGGAAEPAPTSPAVPRLILGRRLQALRRAQYLSRAEAAEALRVDAAVVARLERGRTGVPVRDVADLLTIYGVVEEAERDVLLALAERADTPGWWHEFDDVVPAWLHPYLGLEQAASVIRCFEPQYVPGLLQTEEYARHVVSHPRLRVEQAQLDRRVELRMRRGRVLDRRGGPHLWAVLDEAVLRRPVGGPAVMAAQLRHLVEMGDLPHVTVQVLPFSTGQAATDGPCTLLRLPAGELPDTVYLEQLRSARYVETPDEVEYYRHLIDCLVTDSEPPSVSRALLLEAAAEYAARRSPLRTV